MKPVPGILDIAPYVGGRSHAAGSGPAFKLSSNETPLGPSPWAVSAFREAGDTLHLYPDGSATALREAIGATWAIDPARVVCGNGSDEILHLLPQIYAAPGDEVIHSAHGFLVYPIATRAAGATPVSIPEPALRTDVDAILARAGARTKIVFVANPNNPTGSYNTRAELVRLREGLPRDCLLVIDAAYAEYVDRPDYESGLDLVAAYENTVMTRTFSKIYGLASLRIGWGYGPPDVVDALNRVRGPFNVSAPAQAAAVAALADRDHLARSAAHNAQWRDWLATEVAALGLTVRPSVANFLLIEFPAGGKHTAAAADAFLLDRGIILRSVSAYGLPNALRISVGTQEGNRAAVAALREFLS
jgi:histidinol-phosphate aminotransferase